MKYVKISFVKIFASLTKERDTAKRKNGLIGWQKVAKRPASFVILIAKISVDSNARKRQ